jgi:hypothetical protein
VGIPSRRRLLIIAGSVGALLVGSMTAFAVWSWFPHAPKVALHRAATPAPTPSASFDPGNPFGVVPTDSPSASPTPPETATSPTAAPIDYGLPLPTSQPSS